MKQTPETYLLAALLLVVILGVAIAFLILWRRIPQKPHSSQRQSLKDRPDWPLGIGICLIGAIFFGWLDSRDAKVRAEMEAQGQIRALMNAGYLHPDRAWLKVNLNDCGPRTDGMTDIVVMVIVTEADGKHFADGCSRIAERKYILKPMAKQVQG